MDDKEIIQQAMSLIGSRNTHAQQEARKRNISAYHEQRKSTGVSEETRARLREAQAARRERERQERASLGLVEPAQPPRPRGRPKKSTT